MAVKRAGAIFETTFLRGDGTGRLTNVNGTQSSATTINVDDAIPFRTGQVVEFLNNSTGAVSGGPVKVTDRSVSNATITVAQAVSVTDDDGIYISGEQAGGVAPSEVTALGLPAIVNNSGTIYNLSRSTYPVLQSKVIAAGSVALDEALLRRIRKQIMVETNVDSTDNYAMVSNWSQFDRYSEISLPFRRFTDMSLDLGASVGMTTFEGKRWLLSWAALTDEVFMINLDGIVKGVVRPFGVDERVNAQWIPGQDAFSILLKSYMENIGRNLNASGKITGLSVPTH